MQERTATYRHTQHAPMYLLALATTVILALAGSVLAGYGPDRILLFSAAALTGFLAFCFQTLTVQDEGTHLAIRYGPLPVFHRRFPYAAMSAVQRARSSVLDGWGIHWLPGRGWIFNLWGFDCVEVRLGRRIVRVGSDDAAELARFLQSKLGQAAA